MIQAYYSNSTGQTIDRLRTELGQGILLFGPEGIGLGFTADAIARAHTRDVVTIKPDLKGTIGIESIRELYTLGRSKAGNIIFIIDDADAMGREAQNALLKLLEEPVPSIRFILTSHYPDRLLPTIRSRISLYQLTPISSTQSIELLNELNVTDTTTRAQLIFIAEGLPAAISLYVNEPARFIARSLTVRDARSFLQGSKEARLLLSSGYKEREQAIGLIRDMQKLLRRAIEADPKAGSAESLDLLLETESALMENASVRLSLTSLALSL